MATGERLQGKLAIVIVPGTHGTMPCAGQATSILFTEGSARDVDWAAVCLDSDESRWVSDMGCFGIQVNHPSELSSALDQAFAAGKPAVVDVKTHIKEIAPLPWAPE